MAARNSRPTSGAKRRGMNTQGAGKPKTAGKKNVVRGKQKVSSAGASKSKRQGLVKIPNKQATPKTNMADGKLPNNSIAAWTKYSKPGPKY